MSELRAHFPERDAYLDRLAQHYADGLLDDAGFESRRDILLQSTTHGEMLRAFDGLPRPRYAGESSGGRRTLGRRGLIIGGAVAAAAAGVVAVGVGVFGARAYVPPAEEYYPEATPLGDPEMAMYMPVDYGVLEEAFYTLHERGLTLVSEFSADTAGVDGVAMSPRAPGDLRTFNKRPERPVVVSEAISGEVPRAVELEQLQEMALRALDESMWVLGEEGVADMLELVFTDRGNPTMKVTVVSPFDGRVLGTAQHDVDGNLMALEENQ